MLLFAGVILVTQRQDKSTARSLEAGGWPARDASSAYSPVGVHTARTSQTTNTITIMVPTNPNPSVSCLLTRFRSTSLRQGRGQTSLGRNTLSGLSKEHLKGYGT